MIMITGFEKMWLRIWLWLNAPIECDYEYEYDYDNFENVITNMIMITP